MGKRKRRDGEAEAPDLEEEDTTWWYICTDCLQAFTSPTRLKTHQWTAHKYKGPMANVLIMSQSVDLAPRIRVPRCHTDSRGGTERNVDVDQNHQNPAPHNCIHCPRQFRKLWGLKRHVLLVHVPNQVGINEGGLVSVKNTTPEPPAAAPNEFPLKQEEGTDFDNQNGDQLSLSTPAEATTPQDEDLELVGEKPRLRLRCRPRPSQPSPSPTAVACSDSDGHGSSYPKYTDSECENEAVAEKCGSGEEFSSGGGDSEYEPEYEAEANEEESEGQQEEEAPNSNSGSDSEAEFVKTRKRKRPKGTGTVPWSGRIDADGAGTAEYIRTRPICPICNKSQHDNYNLKRHMDGVHGTDRHDDGLREEYLKLAADFALECQNLQCNLCLTICQSLPKLKQHVLYNHKQHLYRAEKGLPCHCLTCCKDAFLRPAPSKGEGGSEDKWECKLCGVLTAEMGVRRHAKGRHPTHKMGPPEAAGCDSEWRRAKRLLVPVVPQNPKDEEKFTCECDVCGKPFTNVSSMNRHKISHKHNAQKSKGEIRRPFECGNCDKSFKSKQQVQMHQSVHMTESPYACVHCPGKFKTKYHLSAHRSKKHGTGTTLRRGIGCDICGKPCPNLTAMKLHRLTHQARGILCPECGKLFKREADLRDHRRSHSNVRNYKCRQCGKGFKLEKGLKRHQTVVHDTTMTTGKSISLSCPECPMKLKTRRNLDVHSRQMHQRLACRVCGEGFEGERRRNRHEIDEHDFQGAPNAPLLKCRHEGCGKKWLTAEALKIHEESHGDPTAFPCESCGKGFKTERQRRWHQVTIHGPPEELPHACDAPDCGKRFRTAWDVKKHRKHVHEGVKHVWMRPTPCRVCGEEFGSTFRVATHELRVHNFQRGETKSKECKTCGKKFSNTTILKVHELSHSDKRDFICETCGKGFKNKFSLDQHKMTHVPYGELPHLCDVCGKRFPWASHLKDHKRRIHGVGANYKNRVKATKKRDSETEEEESEAENPD